MGKIRTIYFAFAVLWYLLNGVLPAIITTEAVCGVPHQSKEANSVLLTFKESSHRQLQIVDDDIRHAPGATAVYVCSNHLDYRIVGCPAIICLPNGTWSDSQPKCEPINKPTNMSLTPSFNETNKQPPVSEKQCGPPPRYGQNNNSLSSVPSLLTDKIALYHCPTNGWKINECPVLVCNTTTGTWSSDDPPQCVSVNKTSSLLVEVIITPLERPSKVYNSSRQMMDPFIPYSTTSDALEQHSPLTFLVYTVIILTSHHFILNLQNN